MTEIFALFDYVTETQIGGIIPLDIPAHFIVGMVITIILLKCRLPFILTCFIVLVLALFKEAIDYQRMVQFDHLESLKDIVTTTIYPLLLLIVRKRTRRRIIKTQEYYPKS